MDRIYFSVNGKKHSVGSEVDSDLSLMYYIRQHLQLTGTKYMCKEGGCGACIVSVTAKDPYTSHLRTFSVNSCLTSITQCQDWEITTVEGIGNRHIGYHPVQKTLAEHNGTQCGYCSPGWVMSMYSLLESRHYDLTEYEIEDSFGSNTCRCTGYRTILEAFKTFAKDSNKKNKELPDLEELSLCSKKGKCEKPCSSKEQWCWVGKEEGEDKEVKKIKLKDDRIWYRVYEIKDIFDILNKEGYDSYMLFGGNTGKGAYHIFEYPKILIDVSSISELKKVLVDQNLIVGGGTTLTDLMNIFKTVAEEHEEFEYLKKLNEHINLVAHIPVRNVGTVAGNLMVKHRVPDFSSDIFLLLECIGAILTINDRNETTLKVTPVEFLNLDMVGKVIVEIIIPPYGKAYDFASLKILSRSQNAHAQVNGAVLYKFESDHETLAEATVVITGLSATFVHAKKTETCLVGKKIFTNEVLQNALHTLEGELEVEEIAGELSPEYRKKVALSVFYKINLQLIPEDRLKPIYRSGRRDFRRTRPVSKASDVYDTNPIIWPITEPIPKIEALLQTSGEMRYSNDLPNQPDQVFAAFVTSDVATGEILEIDPAPALKIPGVLSFISAKDIPGINNYISQNVPTPKLPLEVLCSGTVKYYDQAIGIIVAETETLAQRAALLVNIKYKTTKEPPILTIKEAREKDPSRIALFLVIPSKGQGVDIKRTIKNEYNIFAQYHYSMETQTCIARPSNDGVELFPTTHWPDLTHVATAEVLNIKENRVDMRIGPLGGSYGGKLSRNSQIAAASGLVTYLTNRPCRFVMSMQANMRVVGKRYPAQCEFEVQVNDKGEIQSLEYNLYEDNGYSAGDLIIFLSLDAVRNCYSSRNWQMVFFNVFTDNTSNTWCRAPGSLEAIAMTETIMEQIAYELEVDPLEVRKNNIDRTNTGIQELIKNIEKDSEYYERREEHKKFNKENRWKKRGLGVALMNWPKINSSGFGVTLTVFQADGSVAIRHGGVDIGQGVDTRIVQVVAYTLNIPISDVRVKASDSVSTPNDFLTGGSATTEAVLFGAIKCCQLLLDRLSPIRIRLGNPAWKVLVKAAFTAGISLQTTYFTTANDQVIDRVNGAAVCEVELDVLTGEHEVMRVDIIEDCGTSINPVLDVGQIEGAFIMGLGYWTVEDLIYDRKTGELLTDRSWYYYVPLAKDIPIDFRVQLKRNSYNPVGTLGGKAVGEPAITLGVCVAFALHDAIAAAREDSGIPRKEWFNVDGPYTLQANLLKSETRLEQFLYN